MLIPINSTKYIFILGCERSGSTWLGNIFDAHEEVEFFMEPLVPKAGIFSNFPQRNIYLGNKDSTDEQLLAPFENLSKIKYGLFYKPGMSTDIWGYQQQILSKLSKLSRWTGVPMPQIITQNQALNLNQISIPKENLTTKNKTSSHVVTKELRLNFKINLLAQVFPEAKYLVSVRHPGAQIASIMRLLKQKPSPLVELGNALDTFVNDIDSSDYFKQYQPLFKNLEANDLENRLVIWWIINYQTLLSDLVANNCQYQTVFHERLSSDTKHIVSDLLNFIGLPVSEHLNKYVAYSSSQKGDRAAALNTVRNSAIYSKQTISKVDRNLLKKIAKAAKHTADPHGLLKHYLT